MNYNLKYSEKNIFFDSNNKNFQIVFYVENDLKQFYSTINQKEKMDESRESIDLSFTISIVNKFRKINGEKRVCNDYAKINSMEDFINKLKCVNGALKKVGC